MIAASSLFTMSWESIWLGVILMIAALVGVGGAFRINPLTMWTDLIEYFSRGPDSDDNLSRMDRQQRVIDTIFWLVILTPLVALAIFYFFYL